MYLPCIYFVFVNLTNSLSKAFSILEKVINVFHVRSFVFCCMFSYLYDLSWVFSITSCPHIFVYFTQHTFSRRIIDNSYFFYHVRINNYIVYISFFFFWCIVNKVIIILLLINKVLSIYALYYMLIKIYIESH